MGRPGSESGANVQAAGVSPLHLAASSGHMEVVTTLVELGADVSVLRD